MKETKICTHCGKVKPVSEFYSRGNGLQSWCKTCCKEHGRRRNGTTGVYRPESTTTNNEKVMNEIKIFENAQFGQIRTAGTADSPIFCAADVCKALGYNNGRDAIVRHCDEGDVVKRDIGVVTGKKSDGTDAIQNVSMTFINESGLYALIFGSKLESAKTFKKWVTSEVLPSIRKTGGYIASTVSMSDEEIMARALVVAQSTIKQRDEKIRMLEQQGEQESKRADAAEQQVYALSHEIEEMQPKVSYYDTILNNKSTVLTTQIALDYGMSAKALNQILYSMRIQHKVGDQWILYAPYLSEGYMHSKPVEITKHDGQKIIKYNSEWTQKGRLFLYDQLKQNNIIPLIEQ